MYLSFLLVVRLPAPKVTHKGKFAIQTFKADYFRGMQLTEVTNKASAKEFIAVNVLMNKNNPNYIRPLDNEVNDVFDPGKNKTFKYGKAKRWVLKDDNGRLTGRIAAFTNSKYINKGTGFPTGGIGFFDCIDDDGRITGTDLADR